MIDDVVANWPLALPKTNPKTKFRKLLRVLSDAYYRIGVDVNNLYEERFIRTAHGTQLEYMGERVNLIRRTNEDDEHYRHRINVGHEAAAADGGWEDFAQLVLSVIDVEPSDINIILDYETELGAVIIEVPTDLIEASQFTAEEAQTELEKAVPADRRVVFQPKNAFSFDGDEEGYGFGEGVWVR